MRWVGSPRRRIGLLNHGQAENLVRQMLGPGEILWGTIDSAVGGVLALHVAGSSLIPAARRVSAHYQEELLKATVEC